MRQIGLTLAALGVATLPAACGGGRSTPIPTITGLAATGGALASASVTAKCMTGLSLSGTTGADGTFSLELADDKVLDNLNAALVAVTCSPRVRVGRVVRGYHSKPR